MHKPDVAEWNLTKRRCLGTMCHVSSFLDGLKFRFDGLLVIYLKPGSLHQLTWGCVSSQSLCDVLAVFLLWRHFLLCSLSAENLLWAPVSSIIPRCIHGLRLQNYCQVLASSLGNFRHFPLNENGSLGRLWKADPCGFERILFFDVVGRLARNCPFQADGAKLDIC